MFERLKKDKEEDHGHCQVPKTYEEDPKLGQWVACPAVT
jgi:hypothetical protein